MARNKKAVDYSQFLDLGNDDEDFASAAPVSKKARVETKREKKEKPAKKNKEESSSPKNSQGKRLPLDDKIYQRDLEVALALSVQETSVVLEHTPSSGSPSCVPSENPDQETSFSNCSVNSSALGLDDITEGSEDPANGRSRRQAASKAITQQRKLLSEDSDGEEDADEFKPEAAVSEDSDSEESSSGEEEEEDDEEFEVTTSKKSAAVKAPKSKNEKKGNNTSKSKKKKTASESDASLSEDDDDDDDDEEFKVKKSKKGPVIKAPKSKNARKENKATACKSPVIPTVVSIKIKPLPPRPTASPAQTLAKPAVHRSPPVGVKRPAWTPPASSGSARSPLAGDTVKSPNHGLRLGLSRLARVKPLHPTAALP
ncbi:RAD51-associated protein 1 isoform X2 [Hyperolius riggenbachi]|uniref:RAD51-associated protein 1 isoform X2 n=1 Tax=Hyperolius riggenbachi TaxID=752182 RepID=UPI0035A3641B